AQLEALFILSYVTTIWGTYFYTKTITLLLLLLPLAIIAWISVIILTSAISILYFKLPIQDTSETSLPPQKNISRHRFIIYLATISKSLFSANFIVPFFAYTLGAQQAGFIKISSHISFLISTIAKHTFGISSTTLLAHLKHEPIHTKKPFFDYFNKKIVQLISSTSLIFLFNLMILPYQFNYMLSRAGYITIIVFLWLNLSEVILITYEKILIIEEKTIHFIVIQLLNYTLIAIAILLHHLFLNFALSITLISFGLIRLLYVSLVSYTIYKLWNLPVNINIKNFKLLSSYTQ
ncbi:MAG TPA: hypothetical protein VJ201_07950, partial [Candidatus Babeliales bacterium]|nr:hypothetical protein [Candidatus Babeliales bacterium]